MRPINLTLLLLWSCFSFGTIHTVSNHASDPAQYSTIAAAIAAASGGDTIYVQASPVDYNETVSFDKKLVIIGPGKWPNGENKAQARTRRFTVNAGGDGSQIIGMRITQSVQVINADNVLIQGCFILLNVSTSQSDNTIIRDNMILNTGSVNPYAISSVSGGNTSTNILIENNLIYSQMYQVHGATLKNNVFTRGITLFKSCSNNTLTNNIFYGAYVRDCNSCTFNNNITFGASNDSLPTSYSGSNNIIGQNPMFVNAPLSYDPFTFWQYDFHLSSGSPAAGTADDNGDMGLYGTQSATISGNANIPQIQKVEVQNSTVPEGGKVNIRIIGTEPE